MRGKTAKAIEMMMSLEPARIMFLAKERSKSAMDAANDLDKLSAASFPADSRPIAKTTTRAATTTTTTVVVVVATATYHLSLLDLQLSVMG